VQIVYQRGAFNAAATQTTSMALLFLSLGLYFRALNFIGGRVFIARQRLLFPVMTSVLVLATHIGLNLALIPIWRLAGVTLSLTLTEIIGATLYFGKLRWDLGPLGGRGILVALAKVGLASSMMAVSLALLNAILSTFTLGTMIQAGLLFLAVLLGAAIYVGTLYLLRMEELHTVMHMGRDFLHRRVNQPIAGDQTS
jgi:putative peptidoglycan lipid II flippase